jgi:hypothetical protein
LPAPPWAMMPKFLRLAIALLMYVPFSVLF